MLESRSLFRGCYRTELPSMTGSKETLIHLPNGDAVSALFSRPAKAQSLLMLAHGAGAGMNHPLLEALARELNSAGVATLLYQFPYMEKGRRLPDAPAVLTGTVRAAAHQANQVVRIILGEA